MNYGILFFFLVLIGILLIYNLGLTVKEGLTNQEVYKLIREEQDEEAMGQFFKDNYNIEGIPGNSINLSELLTKKLTTGDMKHFLDDNNIDIKDKILTDLYAPKTSLVPPVCPACPISCPDKTKCPPCPPCGRCPETTFTCEKVKKEKKSTKNEDPDSDDEFACPGGNCENVDDENEDNEENGEENGKENVEENKEEDNKNNEGDYDVDGFDVDGFDVDGFDFDGFDVDGLDVDGLDVDGLDVDGFDVDGLDVDGLDRSNGGGYKNGESGGNGRGGGGGGNGRGDGGGGNGRGGVGSIQNYNKELEAYCLTNCKGGNLLDNCAQCEPYLNKETNKFCHDDIAGVWNE